MLSLLLPLALAAADVPSPPPERHLTLGVRTAALTANWLFIPDLAHAGAGWAAFLGSTVGDHLEVRAGMEVRSLNQGVGYCLEKCGHPGVLPPPRALRQLELAPWLEAHVRSPAVGPINFLFGMEERFPVGTSLDGADPFTIGAVNVLKGGVALALPGSWTLEAMCGLETGMLLVPGAPEPGLTSTGAFEASLSYRF